jgi:hypothetical protein
MRKLNAQDLFKTATILGKIGTHLKVGSNMTPQEIGINFFSSALQYAESDLKSLLASISEKSLKDFEEMPFDYPIQVIEELAENEDIQSFLERVKSLAKKMQSQ